MYNLIKNEDFEYITFPILSKYDELLHCFTTRKGGVSEGPYESMNLGLGSGDDRSKVRKNYEILAEKLDIDLYSIIKPYQSHTSNIKYVGEKDRKKTFLKPDKLMDVDGLITDKRNVALITIHADCTPIFFYDPTKKVIGMAHAGWRGTVDNIAGKMVNELLDTMDSKPEDIKVAIGPSLGQSCFEVDKDVADIFLEKDKKFEEFMIKKGIKYHFDLWEINKYLLMSKGIKEENIEVSGLCTKCRNDLFFSHRGQKGKRGLMAGLIMLR